MCSRKCPICAHPRHPQRFRLRLHRRQELHITCKPRACLRRGSVCMCMAVALYVWLDVCGCVCTAVAVAVCVRACVCVPLCVCMHT